MAKPASFVDLPNANIALRSISRHFIVALQSFDVVYRHQLLMSPCDSSVSASRFCRYTPTPYFIPPLPAPLLPLNKHTVLYGPDRSPQPPSPLHPLVSAVAPPISQRRATSSGTGMPSPPVDQGFLRSQLPTEAAGGDTRAPGSPCHGTTHGRRMAERFSWCQRLPSVQAAGGGCWCLGWSILRTSRAGRRGAASGNSPAGAR